MAKLLMYKYCSWRFKWVEN